MEPRGLDRPRHSRARARCVCRLARAGPNDYRGGRDLLYLGLVRPRSVAALVGRPDDLTGRRLPPDVPVHGAGRGNGDRGRRSARRLSARDGRPGGGAEALRTAAPAARHPSASDVARQQDAPSPARRPGATGARHRMGHGRRPLARRAALALRIRSRRSRPNGGVSYGPGFGLSGSDGIARRYSYIEIKSPSVFQRYSGHDMTCSRSPGGSLGSWPECMTSRNPAKVTPAGLSFWSGVMFAEVAMSVVPLRNWRPPAKYSAVLICSGWPR